LKEELQRPCDIMTHHWNINHLCHSSSIYLASVWILLFYEVHFFLSSGTARQLYMLVDDQPFSLSSKDITIIALWGSGIQPSNLGRWKSHEQSSPWHIR